MALTLIEAADYIQDPLRRSIVELYAQSTPLMGALPFETDPSGFVRFSREADIGSAGFRSLNEAFAEDSGRLEMVTEHMAMLGGDVDVDKRFVDTGSVNFRSQQESMKVTAIAHQFDYSFVKGDPDDDPESFAGMQRRLAGTAQEVNNGTAGLKIDELDKSIDYCQNPTHIYCLKSVRRRLTAAARTDAVGGQIRYTVDQFGRQVTEYNGLPILEADTFGHSLIPLDFTESSSTTSLYVLSLTPGGLMGIQRDVPDIRDLGELQAKPVFRSRIDWDCGIALMNPRAAVRLKGITDAAATAT